MKIVVVTAAQETLANSLAESQKRLEAAKDIARTANEVMFEKILNLDPDDQDATDDERELRATEIKDAEKAALTAWRKYDLALLRYGWECAQARKGGLTV